MATYVLIHFERNDDEDRIGLAGIYPTQREAQQAMKVLYEAKLVEPMDWDFEMCGTSGIDAVVQTEYACCCHRWFIFNVDDAGIHYIFS